MDKYKHINEAIKNGDFTEFDRLDENQQIEIMKTWDEELWQTYYLRNTISEDELFDELYRIIDNE